MFLDPGTRLLSYEIESLIGSGGMGQVYKAKDSKLGRTVAIKVLPQELASDPRRLKRFEQEARAASALDHPNIITIHDIHETDSIHFIVMQYVAGRTLRELVGTRDLSLTQTLHYAIQIADGLARAHSQGIVHRDLKPDNVVVAEDGLVKILDFGLAKLTESADWAEASTRDKALETGEGQVLGTAPYMSPEQAQGKNVDARSDIFSFGSLLYEMVTGQRAFDAATLPELLTAIMRREPQKVAELVPSAPLDLDKVIHRALRKEPERRFQSMADLRVELLETKEELESGSFLSAEQVSRVKPKQKAWIWVAAIALIATLGAAWWLFLQPREPLGPPARPVPLTSFEGLEQDAALSPDGDQVAFVWNGGEGDFYHLYVKLIGGGDPLQLTNASADDLNPTWNPDGTEIAFQRRVEGGNEIHIVPALGGAERLQTQTTQERRFRAQDGLDWSPDGRFLAIVDKTSSAQSESIVLLSLETGEKREFTTPPDGFQDGLPAFSPDGKSLAYVRSKAGLPVIGDVYRQSVTDQAINQLTSVGCHFSDLDWSPKGEALIFSADLKGGFNFRLWSLPSNGGKLVSLPFGENARDVTVAHQGKRIAYTARLGDTDIWRVSGPEASEPSPPSRFVASSTRNDGMPRYSHDGTRVAFHSDRTGENVNTWVCDSDGANSHQLTREEGLAWAYFPRWAPSDDRLILTWDDTTSFGFSVLHAKGGILRSVMRDSFLNALPSWSHDGRWIYFNSNRNGTGNIWKIAPEGGKPIQLTKNKGANPFEGNGGRLVYYRKTEVHDWNIYSVPVDGGEEKLVLEKRLGGGFQWCLWKGYIVYIARDGEAGPSIEMFDLTTLETTRLVSLGRDALVSQSNPIWDGVTVSPDGQWILYTQLDVDSDLMLVENFR